MRGTGGSELNDDNPGRADSGHATGRNPCTLVSKTEAQAIIGKPLATPEEAPLGPTCIYRTPGATGYVTVAVESLDFAKIRSQLRHPIKVNIGGRAAYCGDYGQPTTYVSLTGSRVLNVTAPCGLGIRFAAKAIGRLKN
jgi:hypothetical protein